MASEIAALIPHDLEHQLGSVAARKLLDQEEEKEIITRSRSFMEPPPPPKKNKLIATMPSIQGEI